MPQITGNGAAPAYRNPFRSASNLVPERVDMGVDFSIAPGSPIYALGNGEILQTKGGWPGGAFIAERLSDGPYAGKIVYVAEDVNPVVQVGQRVTSNDIIGYRVAGPDGIETGWAAPPPDLGNALAAILGQAATHGDPGAHPTAMGASYNNLLVSLGVPSGTFSGPVVGSVPAGYPPAKGGLVNTGSSGPNGNAFGCINAMVFHVAWLVMLLWMALWR